MQLVYKSPRPFGAENAVPSKTDGKLFPLNNHVFIGQDGTGGDKFMPGCGAP
jgi:hypothetical protein